jgi:hypothetical protein
MKTRKAALLFVSGTVLGIFLALCLGAADKSTESPKKEPSRLQLVSYPAGTTGIFDPDSGKLYMYDVNLVNCFMIREVGTLGAPMRQLRN